jgi:hypothetical protein
MNELQQYSILYPKLAVEIILYFQLETSGGNLVHKTIAKFLEYYKNKYSPIAYPQPGIVSRMCDILVDYGNLSLVEKNGMNGLFNRF